MAFVFRYVRELFSRAIVWRLQVTYVVDELDGVDVRLGVVPFVVAEIRILRRGNRTLRGYHAIRWINAVVRASCR